MIALRRFLASRAAQRLARIGREKRRRTVLETAAQIRRELELPDHPALQRRA